MAIQPIDLQTLFTQIDKVGKTQVNQREGVEIQQALQNVQIQKKTEERDHAVNESKNMGEGTDRINDRNARRKQGGNSPRNEGEVEEPLPGEGDPAVIRDPDLGKNVDFSG
ncbi:MAG: hypothetical protein LBQ38_00740 [Spirochaetaceae bacterium]|jgi:hypothetical protein|nr:hypothetical protein [Spirochaetaceae bacterium]